MQYPDFSFEIPLWKRGYEIIGLDEVGRGAFAGPVGVGGVVFPSNMSSKKIDKLLSSGINDSKKLTKKKREELSFIIKSEAMGFFVELINVKVVNKVGVGKAAESGMIEIITKAKSKNQKSKKEMYALIDGFKISNLDISQKAIIKGDCLSLSIAAASIIAKVERDNFMEKLALKYPLYGFDRHKGYGTASHRENIVNFGLSDQHREDFCRKTLTNW